MKFFSVDENFLTPRKKKLVVTHNFFFLSRKNKKIFFFLYADEIFFSLSEKILVACEKKNIFFFERG
jgi:hypothetical protein